MTIAHDGLEDAPSGHLLGPQPDDVGLLSRGPWREGQAAGRASDRLHVIEGHDDARADERPERSAERKEARTIVRDALLALPAAQREALVLAYWGGLTADQIARREHVPLGTAKSRIRLGLARLRQECPALALDAA